MWKVRSCSSPRAPELTSTAPRFPWTEAISPPCEPSGARGGHVGCAFDDEQPAIGRTLAKRGDGGVLAGIFERLGLFEAGEFDDHHALRWRRAFHGDGGTTACEELAVVFLDDREGRRHVFAISFEVFHV